LGRVNQQPIVVVIDDGNGYRSMYVHLERASVEPGQVVSAGDVIGREGMTGFATGCHLHYTMIRMDGAWQAVVPGLARYGYPPYVRERVDALKVLPWGDEFAPQRLRDRIYGTPSPSPASSANPSTTPESTAVPTSTPSESASPTGSN
jgi:murein DD-endopeptidase MepM/ murein hydrolase activator NlpD